MLKKLDGRLVQYVTCREPGGDASSEIVLGKDGRICCADETVKLMAGGKDVFVCPASETDVSELMSLNGAVFAGVNTLTGRRELQTAFYKYYR